MTTVHGVPVDLLPTVWPHVVDALRPSIDKAGTHDPEDVYRTIEQGRAHLYVQGMVSRSKPETITACVVTELLHYPKVNVCRVWLAGSCGKADWRAFVRFLEHHCRQHGYGILEAIGREGWTRIAGGEVWGPLCRKVIV